jgi:hypothetical protein
MRHFLIESEHASFVDFANNVGEMARKLCMKNGTITQTDNNKVYVLKSGKILKGGFKKQRKEKN